MTGKNIREEDRRAMPPMQHRRVANPSEALWQRGVVDTNNHSKIDVVGVASERKVVSEVRCIQRRRSGV